MKTRVETAHFEACLAFYTNVIGLVMLESWDEDGDRGAILGLGDGVAGDAFLELVRASGEGVPSGVGLQLRVPDIDAAVERLRGRWEFTGPEARPWGSIYVRLVDPGGVEVVLYEGNHHP